MRNRKQPETSLNFKATHRDEVFRSRRDRSRRALFAARVIGLLLLLTIVAALRSEPEFRQALAGAGKKAVLGLASHVPPATRIAQTASYQSQNRLSAEPM